MSLQADVRAILAHAAAPMTTAEICEALGITDGKTVNSAIKNLIRDGAGERIATEGQRNRYTLRPGASATPTGERRQRAPSSAGAKAAKAPADKPRAARMDSAHTAEPAADRAPRTDDLAAHVAIIREDLHLLLAIAVAAEPLLGTSDTPAPRRAAAIRHAARVLAA